MNYRSLADLNRGVKTWACALPRGLDLIVGIPRSGLLAANLLALQLDLPLTDVDGFCAGRVLLSGRRQGRGGTRSLPNRHLKALVVDDSLNSGTQMNQVKAQIKAANLPHKIYYGAVYVSPEGRQHLDYWHEIVENPRCWEWNVMHHPMLESSCVDIDGVLCRDPTSEENDDGEKYRQFLRDVEPLVVPNKQIGWIVTCRLEKYRNTTEEWLRRNGFQYGQLVMGEWPDREARIAAGEYGEFKARVYSGVPAQLFIESNAHEAEIVARLARKPVLCTETGSMIGPEVAPGYARATSAGEEGQESIRQQPECTPSEAQVRVAPKGNGPGRLDKSEKLVASLVHGAEVIVEIGKPAGPMPPLVEGAHATRVEIVSLEPESTDYATLRRRQRQKDSQPPASRFAASDTDDRAESDARQILSADRSGGYLPGRTAGSDAAEAGTVDGLLGDLPDARVVVKISAQGNEVQVLRSMRATCSRLSDVRLLVEMNPELLRSAGHSARELVDELFSLGFDVYVLAADESRHYKIPHSDPGRVELYLQEGRSVRLLCMQSSRSLSLCLFSHLTGLAGAERSLLQLVTELVRDHGILCTVVLPADGPLKPQLEEAGASTVVAQYPWWCSPERMAEADAALLMAKGWHALVEELLPVLNEVNADVFLTNTITIPWGAASAMLAGKPHIWFVREFGEEDHGLKFFLPLEDVRRFIRESSSVVLTNSMAVAEAMRAGDARASIVPAYVDIQVTVPPPPVDGARFFHNPNAVKLLLLGRIAEGKGQRDAVSAVAELTARGHDVELLLMGSEDPEYSKALRSKADELGLRERVRFEGFAEDPYPVIAEADIVLVCSRKEAFGRTAVEAMLLGKPVVASNAGGLPEIVRHGSTGFLYEPGNPVDLADKLETLVRDEPLRAAFGREGASVASSSYTPSGYGGKVARVVRNLKRARSCSPSAWLLGQGLSDVVSAAILEKNKAHEELQTRLAQEKSEQEQVVRTLEQLQTRLAQEKSEQEQVVQTLEQLQRRLAQEKSEQEQIVQTLQTVLARSEELVAQQATALETKEKALSEAQEREEALLAGTTWNLVMEMQRIRLKLAPPGTFGERVLRLVVRAGIAWKRKGLAYVARRGFVKALAHLPWRGSCRRAQSEARASEPSPLYARPTLLAAVGAIAAAARRKGGLVHLAGRALRLMREKGFREAFRRAYAYCTVARSAAPVVATPYEPYLPSEEEAYIAPHAVTDLPADLRVAVVVHAFYPDVFPEFCQYLRNMPCRYTLLVSVQGEDARRKIEAEAASLPLVERVEVRVVPNRGRDIAPLLVEFGPLLRSFDYVCHIHTKRSLHTASGDAWRRYLCGILLGSTERIQALLATFVNDGDVGLVYPEPYKDVPYVAYGWLKNGAIAGELWARLGIPFDPTGYVDMPAGSMFWARRSALEPLLDLHLAWTDFPDESSQTEGTLQHTIERCFVPVARKSGYKCLVIKEAEPLLFSLHDHRNLRQYLATPFEAKLRNVLPAAEVVSFDIFDTLLVRPFHRPDMVLRYLEHRVARELGIHGYFDLRKQAEETARARKGPAGDVTLAEIYAALADKFAIDHGTALKMLNMEVSVELSLLRRRETIPEIGEEIRATGKRVILVSDFYWERPRVEAMLAEKGIAFHDELYLSSAVGKRKDRGDLWEHVVQQEGVPKTSLLHVGDNEHSDILELWDRGFMAPVHVMRPAVLFQQSKLGEVLHRVLSPDDGWENSLLYGLCANRLCSQPDGRGTFSSSPPLSDPQALGYVAFGPLVYTFVAWLARASSQDGVKQLKFLSREGLLLNRAFGLMAEHVARFSPMKPLAQGAYFLCSRRAMQFACLETEADVSLLLTKDFRGTLRQLLDARFQIADMHTVEERLGSRKLDAEIALPESYKEVSAAVVRVFDVLREQAEREREALRKYCAEQGLDGTTAVGLVDIGYSGSIQAAMARLLRQQLRGYYFATSASAQHTLGEACQACFASFVDSQAGDSPGILRYNLLLEAVLTASTGQLIRFEESSEGVIPVFKRPGVAQRRFSTILRMQEGILDFVRDMLSLFGPDGANIEFPRELVQQCFSLVARGELSVGDLQTALQVEDDYCGRGEVDVLAGYRNR